PGVVEVEVLHAQPQALAQPEARAVEHRGHEAVPPLQPAEQRRHLGAGEHDGEPLRAAGPNDAPDAVARRAEDGLVEAAQRVEGLVLRGRRDAARLGEVGEEGGDLGLGHRRGVTRAAFRVAVEAAEAPGPVDVGLLGAVAVVPEAAGGADAVEEPRGLRVRRPADGMRHGGVGLKGRPYAPIDTAAMGFLTCRVSRPCVLYGQRTRCNTSVSRPITGYASLRSAVTYVYLAAAALVLGPLVGYLGWRLVRGKPTLDRQLSLAAFGWGLLGILALVTGVSFVYTGLNALYAAVAYLAACFLFWHALNLRPRVLRF